MATLHPELHGDAHRSGRRHTTFLEPETEGTPIYKELKW